MANKKLSKSISAKFLGFLWKRGRGTIDEFAKDNPSLNKSRKFLSDTALQLQGAGALEEVSRQKIGRRVIKKFKLTSKGMLRAVNLCINRKNLKKLFRERRLIIFDIPEEERLYRDYFRQLMKDLGCKMVQLSVWQADFELPEDFLLLVRDLGLEHKVIIYKIRDGDTLYL